MRRNSSGKWQSLSKYAMKRLKNQTFHGCSLFLSGLKALRNSFIYALGALSFSSWPLAPDYGRKSREGTGYKAPRCIGSELWLVDLILSVSSDCQSNFSTFGKSKGRAVIPPKRLGFKYRCRRHMWVSVGFLLCSELPSSKFSNYGERSEARENARDRSGGKGELSLSFPARRTRISFRVLLSWPSRDSSKCRVCSQALLREVFLRLLKVFPSP